MVELLIDCVRNHVFSDWEVNEQLRKSNEEIAEAAKNPQGLLLEGIYSAGYSGALANPLLAPESAVNILNGRVLEDFVAVRKKTLFCMLSVLFWSWLWKKSLQILFSLKFYQLPRANSTMVLCLENTF